MEPIPVPEKKVVDKGVRLKAKTDAIALVDTLRAQGLTDKQISLVTYYAHKSIRHVIKNTPTGQVATVFAVNESKEPVVGV